MSHAQLELQIELSLDSFQLAIDYNFDQQVLGVFGPSGSGKTSLLESIAGLRKTAGGRIACGTELWLDSTCKHFTPPEHRSIGYVPQEHLLFPQLNVLQNLCFSPRSHQSKRLAELCELLELQPLLKRRINQLSGGEKQRVALGRALNAQPKMLLLDEPLAALDSSLRRKILPFLIRIKQHFSLPMLIISHNPIELQLLCDQVIALRQGKIRHSGSALQVLCSPEFHNTSTTTSGFENILPVEVCAQSAHSTRCQYGPLRLIIPHTAARIGQSLRIGLPAQQLLIATQAVSGLSAPNQISAQIQKIEGDSSRKLVTLSVATELPPLVAELTHESCQTLQLKIDHDVYLIFKSSALHVYA
jgi:molybdate transport system ATP-binding protein